MSNSTEHRAIRFFMSNSASSFPARSIGTMSMFFSSARFISSLSPSRIFSTQSYVMRAVERITPSQISCETIFPSPSKSIMQLKTSLSTPSLSEQMPFDSFSGSIGSTRSAKYTLVPRSIASRSSGDPSVTYSATSAICTKRRYPSAFFITEIASSKSFDVAPSTVTTTSPRKSRLFFSSASDTSFGIVAVSRITAEGKSSRSLYERITPIISARVSPSRPKTSAILQRIGLPSRIFATTLSPFCAFMPLNSTLIEPSPRSDELTLKPSNTPTTSVILRCNTFNTSHSPPPLWLLMTLTTTSSPWIAPKRSRAAMKRSSPPSFGIRNAKPFPLPCTLPST